MKFDSRQLDAFRSFSHDRNPLHGDADYARRTPFGEPVAFGVLGIFELLARWNAPAARRLTRLEATFKKPLHAGTVYETRISEGASNEVLGTVSKGGVTYCQVRWTWDASNASVPETETRESYAPLAVPSFVDPTRLPEMKGRRFENYKGDAQGLSELRSALGPGLSRLPLRQLEALAWTSYFVGMHCPGRQALFSDLLVTFDGTEAATPLVPRVNRAEFDDRFNRMVSEGVFEGEGTFKTVSFVRPPPVTFEEAEIERHLPTDASLRGRTAVITGATRGFGLCLAHGFARKGAALLLSRRRSSPKADSLSKYHPTWFEAEIPGFAPALETALETRKTDFLILNAFPAIRARSLAELTREEIQAMCDEALKLVIDPIKACASHFSDRPVIVYISTEYVRKPVAQFSHYVAAKAAAEGFLRGLASEHPKWRFLIARPPRMLTDQTNSVFQTQPVANPLDVAAALLENLAAMPGSSNLQEIDL